MRVLILSDRIPPEHAGGAETIAWSLAGGLRDLGFDIHVAAATPGPAFEAIRDGIPTYHLHVPAYRPRWRAYLSLYHPAAARGLCALYERLRPDVVNAHNVHSHLTYFSLALARRMGIPTVFSAHDVMPFAYAKLTFFVGPDVNAVTPEMYRLPPLYNLRSARLRYNPLRNPAIRRILGGANARTCVSEALRAALEANGLPPFRVVHNGVAPERWAASPEVVERLRARLGLEGRRVILFAGRLTREKGSAQLLAALDRLAARVPDALLLALARGELAGVPPHLRENHVRAGGWLEGDELAAAYQLADVFAVPSVCFDSFPTVILEAMAAGKPVVATIYGGAPEAVVDGQTGFLVNPFDTAALADRLERLLLDAGLRRQMGQAGQARLLERFTLRHQAAAMAEVYAAAAGL
jgi:glycosyltransferase involved in cell wall biosynthesis